MKKVLTFPSEIVNYDCDNINNDLVVTKGYIITKNENLTYMVIDMLGKGTFGQVFRCVSNSGEEVAIKIIKNEPKYFYYEMNEVKILKKLKDLKSTNYFIELIDAFMFKKHLCIVLELLNKNLFDISRFLQFVGMEFMPLRMVLTQVLKGLEMLNKTGIIHCDIKPENILLTDAYQYNVKIIDFGSSSLTPFGKISYIQSRFYRAPEVILGIPYGTSIDVWSFGCMAYELYTGKPLFPGTDNFDQIQRINEFFPKGIPKFMLDFGSETHQYFDKENHYRGRENHNKFTKADMLEAIARTGLNHRQNELLANFVLDTLNPSYIERMTPSMLLEHPFFHEDVEEVSEAVMRQMGNPIPPKVDIKRKKSYQNLGFFDSGFNKSHAIRKMSVFDFKSKKDEQY